MRSIPSILLIEDDEDDYVVVREMLSQIYGDGLQLEWTTNADEGLSAIVDSSYDLYLVDYRLGKRDGVELVRKGVAAGCRAPLILLTGLASRTTDLEAMSAGAADYLVKAELTVPLIDRAIRYAMTRQKLLATKSEANDLLRRKNEKLAALYRTAHHFVDDLSHEFRTPLTVIKEYASILQDGLAGEVNEEQESFLEIIINRVQDLSIMVNDMLDMSRLEAGLIGVSRSANRVDEILAHVVPDFERKSEATGCALRLDVQADLPAVYCDFEKVGRVVVNLMVNAFKYAGEGREIAIWARHDPSKPVVVVGVTDKGPGIPSSELETIFARFKQLEGEIRSSTKGFGLGLSIVKELVHLNFGEIWVASELGEGSTFSFSIPTFDPGAIMVRYLSRVEYLRNGSSHVSLVHLTIADEADAISLETVEQVLLPNVRRSDLLFRRSPNSWLLVAAANNLELDPLLHRLVEVWERENRNRPGRALPHLTTEIKGAWKVSEQRQAIIKRFEKEFLIAQKTLGSAAGLSEPTGPNGQERGKGPPAAAHNRSQSESEGRQIGAKA